MVRERAVQWSAPRLAAGLTTGLILALLLGACGARADRERPQRLVLVTLDTLRLDTFTGTAQQPTDMPLTQAWAEHAAVFSNYYSVTSSTQPTHASLFCGNQPWEHGVTANGMLLPAAQVTLAERLRAAGWSTSAVVASGPLHASLGFDQGFDSYVHGFTLEEGAGAKQNEAHAFARGDHISDLALEALGALNDLGAERQFLWVHYFDPHAPYGDSELLGELAASELLSPMSILVRIKNGQSEAADLLSASVGLYRDDVGFMDRQLARLLERLEADSERFDTHIVLVSDHGELFGEDGSIGHGKRLLPELLNVPLLIRSPRTAPGSRAEAASTTDVAATLFDLAGFEDLGAGESLLSTLDPARTVYGMRRTFAETYEERRIDNSLHPLDTHSFFAFDGKRLFTGNPEGIRRDDGQRELREGERRTELMQRFARYQARIEGLTIESSTNEDTLRALEQLGYTR